MIFLFVFFFKQKTAYEVRISDWSSDVCSSDLLLMHPRCASVDYSRLKYILYGAAPIPLDLLRQCMRMFGAQFIQAYGMTETTGTISMLPPEDHDPRGNKRMRSAGKPLKSEEHTSELQSLLRIPYAVFRLKKKKQHTNNALN